MQYKTCKKDSARTTGYIGSTNNPYDEDVNALREDIRRNNREVRELHKQSGQVHGSILKLRVRPRGPRRPYSYDTLLKDARYFDVYRSEDYTKTMELKYNLK